MKQNNFIDTIPYSSYQHARYWLFITLGLAVLSILIMGALQLRQWIALKHLRMQYSQVHSLRATPPPDNTLHTDEQKLHEKQMFLQAVHTNIAKIVSVYTDFQLLIPTTCTLQSFQLDNDQLQIWLVVPSSAVACALLDDCRAQQPFGMMNITSVQPDQRGLKILLQTKISSS